MEPEPVRFLEDPAGQPVVHPSAVVHPGAELEPGAVVGPFCLVESGVRVGAGSRLEAGTQLLRGTRLGRDNRIGPGAVLGGAPMDHRFSGEDSGLVVGDRNLIREFVTVHRATGEGEVTRLGSDNVLMAYSHLGHNGALGNHVTVTNLVQLAGHTVVEDWATLGGMSGTHQFCRVGAYAMVGGYSKVARDVLPYSLADGRPAEHYRLNLVGLRRAGLRREELAWLGEALTAIRRREGLGPLEARVGASAHLAHLLRFAAGPSRRGLSGFAAEPEARGAAPEGLEP